MFDRALGGVRIPEQDMRHFRGVRSAFLCELLLGPEPEGTDQQQLYTCHPMHMAFTIAGKWMYGKPLLADTL